MSALCMVDGCDNPVSDAYVCMDCAGKVERDLGDVSWLLHELDLSLTRQSARGEHVGGPSTDQPLPFAWDPADLRWALENTITTWARMIVEEQPVEQPAARSRLRGPACEACDHRSCVLIRHQTPLRTGLVAAWMTGQVEWLRHHPAGADAVDEITACVERARRAVDSRPVRLYAGPCGIESSDRACGHDLYADPKSAVVTCPACGHRYDVAERKEWLMDAARDHLATATEASALCWRMLGDLVTTAMIRGYVRRGRLASHTSRREGSRDVALYRIGDIIDAAQSARWDEREQRATRRAGVA